MRLRRLTDLIRSSGSVGPTIILLAVVAKGLAFLREPFIAAIFGASASSDAYFLSIGLPLLAYNIIGLPFSQWVTVRLASGKVVGERARELYLRSLVFGGGGAVLLALLVYVLCRPLIETYAPGLEGPRLDQAVALTRVGVLALPALALQALTAGRLYAMRRFVVVYVWLALGGLVGLGGVMALTPTLGATGAVFSFVAAWWTPAVALVFFSITSRKEGHITPATGVELAHSGLVWRAVALQLFFQGNALLVYAFASRLEVGQIASTLFASKIIMTVYETIILTAGVMIFPGVVALLQRKDDAAAGMTIQRALDWVVPVTIGLILLLVVARTELVTLIYRRRAFDERAVLQVSISLLGYAPYLLGITLVEILHRVMVIRGRVAGYFLVFGAALAVNWVASEIAVRSFGLLGVSLGGSIGALSAGVGLWLYAHHEVPAIRSKPIAVLIARTIVASIVALSIMVPLRRMVRLPDSYPGRLLLLGVAATGVGSLFAMVLWALGHRWRWARPLDNQAASV